ncbi:MAG: acetylornithine deacetylase [Acidobacteriota bacterium]
MTTPDTPRILDHLAALVACDTQNPPRRIAPDDEIFRYLGRVLEAAGGFRIDVTDHREGRVSCCAVRGESPVLFNVHLDTVPVGTGWRWPALELKIEGGRAYGRGACDIKGAAAVLLALAETTDLPMALLLTTDEEGVDGCCVAQFADALAEDRFRQIVVAEPTRCRAVLAHRGYLSVTGRFHGQPGHSSEPRALTDSAVHRACQWATRAVEYAAREVAEEGGGGMCFNIGTLNGGSASNVIAHQADVHWSARLAPGGSNEAALAALAGLTEAAGEVRWEKLFSGPPLPAHGQSDPHSGPWAQEHGIAIGQPVDFWTEAALFSAAGHRALVLGPGDIEQAHTADEWVSLDQLNRAAILYQRILSASAHGEAL